MRHYPVFRLNKKLLRDYPNLWAYARDLYQTPGFGDTTNLCKMIMEARSYRSPPRPIEMLSVTAPGWIADELYEFLDTITG
ncbi:MAG: hypothetical protein ACLU80_05050 [Dorea sp.]